MVKQCILVSVLTISVTFCANIFVFDVDGLKQEL